MTLVIILVVLLGLMAVGLFNRLAAPESVQGMFIENQETGFYSLFATHPPIGKRIEALVRFAGGHDSPAPLVEAASTPVVEPARTGPWSKEGPWG